MAPVVAGSIPVIHPFWKCSSVVDCTPQQLVYNWGMKMTKLKPKTNGVELFRKNVLARMEEANIGPSQLARLAEVDRSGISKFLHGKQDPTLGWCFIIAEALELSLADLVGK